MRRGASAPVRSGSRKSVRASPAYDRTAAAAAAAPVLVRAVDVLARTIVCQPAEMVGPLPEAGLSTLACLPQSLLEETIHSQVPLLEEPERKTP
jgi:hypothetical protein